MKHQPCVGGRWGDRDQPSRMSSDLDSKSTQTRGSPTCQTERVTRAHYALKRRRARRAALVPLRHLCIRSARVRPGHSGGRADTDAMPSAVGYASRDPSGHLSGLLAGIHADPLLLFGCSCLGGCTTNPRSAVLPYPARLGTRRR